MKNRYVSILFLMTLLALSAKSQSVSNWDKLISSLLENDWNNANKLSGKLLKTYKQNDDSRELARLRYMYIYSIAGLVGDREISRENALKKVKKFEGKKIEMPGHTVSNSEVCIFNCYWYAKENDSINKRRLYSAATNASGTYIHSFEYFILEDPIELDGLVNQMLTIGGILSIIELQGVSLSTFRIEITNAYYEF